MRIEVIHAKDEMYRLMDDRPLNPHTGGVRGDAEFQKEIKFFYDTLVTRLLPIGNEGDYGDYALGPCLRDFDTVVPRANPTRAFHIEVLKKKMWGAPLFKHVHEFLSKEAANYKVEVGQSFNPM